MILQDTLNTIIQAVIIAVVPILTGYAVAFIKHNINLIAAQTTNEKVKRALEELGDTVSAAVAHTSQTYVDDIKKSGVFYSDDQQYALAKAKATTLATLTPATHDILKTTYDDLQTLVETKIEEAIRKQKTP